MVPLMEALKSPLGTETGRIWPITVKRIRGDRKAEVWPAGKTLQARAGTERNKPDRAHGAKLEISIGARYATRKFIVEPVFGQIGGAIQRSNGKC